MRNKVVVVGLDSATFDLIEPFIKEGYLPNLKHIMDEGVSRILKSTVPPVSPPAWTTFLTGMNPGKHGIFQFVDMDVKNYHFLSNRLINSSLFSGNTFIDYISGNDLKVGTVKIPFTYPPWEVNGFMIAGEPSPDWQKAHTYPPELSEELGKVNYGSSLDFMRYGVDELLKHLKYDSDVRTKITCEMMEKEVYDFFMVVQNITDSASHRFWKYTDPSCPNYSAEFVKYKNILRDVYTEADNSVESILKRLDSDTTLFIMSDHGASRKPVRYFNANLWLNNMGYLQFKENRSKAYMIFAFLSSLKYLLPPVLRHQIMHIIKKFFLKNISNLQSAAADIAWEKTKAYSVDIYTTTAGIVLNLKDRQENGIVASGKEAELLCRDIESRLMDLKDPLHGRRVVEKVYRREEVFRGPFMEKMPELIVKFNGDYRRAKKRRLPLFSNVHPSDFDYQSGDHDENGIFMAYGKNIKKGVKLKEAKIQDMAPTILYSMGLPVPDDMDGKILADVFDESFNRKNQAKTTKVKRDGKMIFHDLSGDEEDKMKEQLQGLGYM